MVDTVLTLDAHAKVNLTLEVVGLREDGYHDVASIMQTVDLHDTLTLEPADDLVFECDSPEIESDDNLVVKAARQLRERSGTNLGARLVLSKRIPVASGLGGGSSDAAATLKGLNTLWNIGMSTEQLMPIAAELGSDVPFFLYEGTAMVQGRGERVRPVRTPDTLQWLVILSPAIELVDKTATLYARLARSDFSPGQLTRKLEARIRGGGDAPPQFLFNAFDGVAVQVFPGLDQYWKMFETLGAREIHLAGSGPSLYAPVSRKETGTALSLMLEHRHGWESHLVSLWRPDGEAG